MEQIDFKVKMVIRNRYLKNYLRGIDYQAFPVDTWNIDEAAIYESEEDAQETLEHLGDGYELIIIN